MASLFPRPQSSLSNRLGAIKGMVGGDPSAFARQMMASNPSFADFVRQNQGKSPEQIAQEHGIDWNAIRQFM